MNVPQFLFYLFISCKKFLIKTDCVGMVIKKVWVGKGKSLGRKGTFRKHNMVVVVSRGNVILPFFSCSCKGSF